MSMTVEEKIELIMLRWTAGYYKYPGMKLHDDTKEAVALIKQLFEEKGNWDERRAS